MLGGQMKQDGLNRPRRIQGRIWARPAIVCVTPGTKPNRKHAVRHLHGVSAISCLVLFGLLLFALPGRAQVDRGTITGTITDVTGAVIPRVKVTAINPNTEIKYTAVSNGYGIYNLINLPIATYDIRYSKSGFAAFERDDVAIQVQQRVQINVRLKVGSENQTVHVTAAPLLKTQTALGTNMTSKDVTDLPLSADNGRDITSFAFAVTPTLTGTNYAQHVGGTQEFTSEVLIDGTSADSGQVGFIGAMEPPMDAVSQFQVDTSGISAAAGRTGGGAFLFELKSGTNHIHGSAFGILANKVLNANTWENDYFRSYYDTTDPANSATYNQKYAKPRSSYDDWGISGGGPLWRNHMFLFVAFERYHQSDFSVTDGKATVPTAAFLNGDFSALLQKNKPPIGTDPAGNPIYEGAIFNPATGDVFPNNVIPQSMFSSVSQKVVAIYKKYYQPTFSDRLIDNYPALNSSNPLYTRDQWSFKYDWALAPNNKVTSSYIYSKRPRYESGGLWESGTQSGGPLSQGAVQLTDSHAYRVSDAWTINSNLLNVAAFTFNEFQNKAVTTNTVAGNTNWPQQIGLGADQSIENFPVVAFGRALNGVGEATIGSPRTPLQGYVAYNGIFDDTVTWIHGRHNINLGLEVRALGFNEAANAGALHFTFSNLTGAPDNAKIQSVTGFGFANFLLGDVYNASKDEPLNQDGRRKELAFFGEDAFRVTPKLTLDYALRWDIPLAEHVLHGEWSNFTLTAKNPNFGSYLGSMQYLTSQSQTFETHNNFHQFSPHFGASYAIKNRMVLRGSYGMYYVPLGNNGYGPVPYSSATGYTPVNQVNPPIQSNSYQFNWDNGYPGHAVTATRNNDSAYVPQSPVSVSPNTLTMGYTQNWNVNLQYQVGRTWVLHASYIGNIGRNLHDGALDPYNWPTWSVYSRLYASGNVNKVVQNPAEAQAAGVPYPYAGWTGRAHAAIDPYPQVGRTNSPIYFANNPLGQSGYNALVLQVTKRDAHGLSMSLSYTNAKATGNTVTAFTDTYSASHGYQDPYEYKHYASYPLTYQPPQEFKGFVNYHLPFGRGRRFFSHSRLENILLGGWLTGLIVRYDSGTPMGVVHANNHYPGWSAVWADVAPHANFKNTFKKLDLINPADKSNQFVNPAIFSNPPDGQLGNSPAVYSGWHGWGDSDEDASLLKRFAVGPRGRYSLTLRGEFFNVLNRHHWANPVLNIASPYFGDVTHTTGTPRLGQVGVRLSW